MSPDALRRIKDAESRSCFFHCLVSSNLFAWYVAAVEFIFNSTCCSYAAERARSEVEENTRSLSSDIINRCIVALHSLHGLPLQFTFRRHCIACLYVDPNTMRIPRCPQKYFAFASCLSYVVPVNVKGDHPDCLLL